MADGRHDEPLLREPLVATAHGGSHGGGATLTAFGASILARYRDLDAALVAAAAPHADALLADLRDVPRPMEKS